MKLKDEAEAQLLIDSILAKAQSDAIMSAENARSRQRLAEANRTAEAREESVTYLSNRLRGEEVVTEAPESFRSRTVVEAPPAGTQVVRATEPVYYEDNHRVKCIVEWACDGSFICDPATSRCGTRYWERHSATGLKVVITGVISTRGG